MGFPVRGRVSGQNAGFVLPVSWPVKSAEMQDTKPSFRSEVVEVIGGGVADTVDSLHNKVYRRVLVPQKIGESRQNGTDFCWC